MTKRWTAVPGRVKGIDQWTAGTEKPKPWRARYEDSDGKQRSMEFRTRKEAERFKLDVESRKTREQVRPERGRITLAEHFEEFMDTAQLRASTAAMYRSRWVLYLGPVMGKRQLVQIHREDVLRLLSDMRKDGRGEPTIRQVHALLRALLNRAVYLGRVTTNEAILSIADSPRPTPKRIRVLTADEVRRVAEAVPPRQSALVWTLAYSGIRVGEAAGLRIENLDLDKGIIRVVENSVEVEGRKVVGKPKTHKGDRDVVIPQMLATKLKSHLKWFTDGQHDSLVFTSEQGKELFQGNWRKRTFQPACERAGVGHVTTHSLRHSAASFMAAAGMTVVEVAKQLGHSPMVCANTYSHAFDHRLTDRMTALDSMMGEG